jgi:hypothetical protein
VLDSGDISVESLELTDSVVTWINGGTRRSGTLH